MLTVYRRRSDMTWIQTYTGKRFSLLEPKAADVDIKDIAHALAHLCRFTGHSKWFYSVAQHSVLASLEVRPEFARAALLHDAAEAYIGDVSAPLKYAMAEVYGDGDHPYAQIEDRIAAVVSNAFGLNPEMLHHPAVRQADLRMLMTERRDLMHTAKLGWNISAEPYPTVIVPWSAYKAEQEFLARLQALKH